MTKIYSQSDVLLIGGGIMSATLGTLLKEVSPDWKIHLFEQLDAPAKESSHALNNAGTGHAALCELNYTSEKEDGTIDITKAIQVNEQFHDSLQFWSYLVKKGYTEAPASFIRALPHMSMVQGKSDINFLKKRYESMKKHPLFRDMLYTEDTATLKEWFPLIMKERPSGEPLAATKMEAGTDVNFGKLTSMMIQHLQKQDVEVRYNYAVQNIKKLANGMWEIKVLDKKTGSHLYHQTKFVFLGAGGGSLHLLQKTGIPESKHIGGFPISGLFLVCNNPDVVNQHQAKVYGKAAVGAPPMSVPHLDTRYIDGEKSLLFGPFAGFSPKFLKNGSMFDLFTSMKWHNLLTLLSCGAKNLDLTAYLVKQLLLSKEKRMKELRLFAPTAKSEDWDIIIAGQRVQVIKDTPKGRGTLQFGTEVVTSEDGSVAALLGASPGASTAVTVMLEVMERCFPNEKKMWEPKIKEMIPSYGQKISENNPLLESIRQDVSHTLQLH